MKTQSTPDKPHKSAGADVRKARNDKDAAEAKAKAEAPKYVVYAGWPFKHRHVADGTKHVFNKRDNDHNHAVDKPAPEV